MNNVLLIENPENLSLFKTAKIILKQKGYKGKILIESWNKMLTGIHGGKRLAKIIKREQIDILFIHFSRFCPFDDAQEIINTIEKSTDVTIVVITNVDPKLTYGVEKSLQKPFKIEDFLKLIMENDAKTLK